MLVSNAGIRSSETGKYDHNGNHLWTQIASIVGFVGAVFYLYKIPLDNMEPCRRLLARRNPGSLFDQSGAFGN